MISKRRQSGQEGISRKHETREWENTNGKKVSVLSIRTFLLSMDFFAHHFAVLSIVYPFTSNSIQKSLIRCLNICEHFIEDDGAFFSVT